ncbi:MAG TPA: iron-sulfur cluster assembly protein [Solirubrobacteraceae bacterium]|nr:iron-sulfur cluster assembly protein [Solirubrobacteraceae bacterium]
MSAPATTARATGRVRRPPVRRPAPARDAADVGLRARVLAALAAVRDPELDEPITDLRFVSAIEVGEAGEVTVRLRLPTPQCAPNFAFLMGADARRAVARVRGVRRVIVRLEDHYTGEEINRALRGSAGFSEAFPGETDDDDLETLRAIFTRKALIARQATVCERMLADGWSEETVLGARVRALPDLPEARRALMLRAELGLPTDGDSPAFVEPGGQPAGAPGLRRWLRGARLVRLSLEANGGICRDLLRARHGPAADLEEAGR